MLSYPDLRLGHLARGHLVIGPIPCQLRTSLGALGKFENHVFLFTVAHTGKYRHRHSPENSDLKPLTVN